MASDSENKPEQSAPGENAGLPPAAQPPLSQPTARAGHLSLEDFILLNEEIAGMAKAGLPLDQGLAALAKEMGSGKLRSMTAQIAGDLRDGATLPEAVERQAGRLPAYYARLLAAGIRSGRVGDVMSTLTVYARTLADLRNTVLSALLYPLVVLVLSLGVFGALSVYIAPMFKKIFKDFGIKLPWLTQMMFSIFDQGLWIFVVAPLAVVAIVFVFRYLLRQAPPGRRAWAQIWYAVPVVGALLRSARLAAFTDLMGILVDNSVPLPEAFLLAGQSSSDPLTVAGAEHVHAELSQGVPLGRALRSQRLVPEVVAWMIALGEKRGTLGPALHQAGDMYRRQVEMRAGLLRSLLPPFFVIFVAGFLVAMFMFALLLPLFSLIESLGGVKK